MTSKRKQTGNAAVEVNRTERRVDVSRCGEWLPPDELRRVVLESTAADSDLTLNLEGIDHLDGSSLQTLLALSCDQQKRGRKLRLTQASPALLQWFEFAGATQRLRFA